MSLMFVLASIFPVFILAIGLLFIIFMEGERIERKSFLKLILLFTTFLNTLLLLYYFLEDLVVASTNLRFDVGTFFITEMILLLSLIVLLFSNREGSEIMNERLMDGLLVSFILFLIIAVVSSNVLIIIACFIILIILNGVLFYFGDYPKEFQLLKSYFLGVGISIILLFSASYLIFLETGTLNIEKISANINGGSNLLITILLIFGFGIPCGIVPFSLFHLKDFYQNNSYANLFLYSIFSFINILLLMRLLVIFSLSLLWNGIIIFIIGSTGLIISLVYIITELFTSLDGNTFSLKKLFGYSINSDFNMVLLFISYVVYLKEMKNVLIITYLDLILFFYFILVMIRTILFYTFLPVVNETFDDNIKLLGDFWKNYKYFGYFFLVSALFLSFPLSFFILNQLLTIIAIPKILGNSLISLLGFLITGIYVLYLIINLIFFSITFVQVYFSNTPRYIERKDKKELNRNYLFPLIVILALMVVVLVIFLIAENVLYHSFAEFLVSIA